jgi:high-affinity iron transporter
MLQTLIITFREGLESFLIVAIMLAYLTKTGRHHLKTPVYWGIAAALLVSATTAWHVAALAQNPVWEGSLAIASGIMVASFTIYVMRTAKNIRSDINHSLEENARKAGFAAAFGIFLFTVLMVAREGMETAMMLGTMTATTSLPSMLIGGVAGLGLMAVIGGMWVSHGHKINIKLFLQVTGIFLVLFSIYLFAYGVSELSEVLEHGAGEVESPDELAWEALLGQIASYGLLAVPCLWLGYAWMKDKFFAPKIEAAE